jgi:hypothetical protein
MPRSARRLLSHKAVGGGFVGYAYHWRLTLMPRHEPIAPMTLGNMRENGVRSLLAYCSACPCIVVFNVDTRRAWSAPAAA